MPLQLEIIRATEFIRVGAQGQFDLAASKAALAAVAGACRKRGINNAVLDLRALQPGPKPVFTKADLVELVNTFPKAGFTQRLRLAILYRSDPHKRAQLFAFLSAVQGWSVEAFGDFEDALLYLSRGQETALQPGRASAGQAIPIQFSTPDADADAPTRTASPARPAGELTQPGKKARLGHGPKRRNRTCAGPEAAKPKTTMPPADVIAEQRVARATHPRIHR